MIFGGIDVERLQLNEDTLYSEEPHQGDLPLDIQGDFTRVEDMLRAGDYEAASTLITEKWTGRSWPCYQPMADLEVRSDPSEKSGDSAAKDYTRELDLSSAISRTRYVKHDVTYTRDYFASFPDRVIVVRFQASQADALSFSASLRSDHPTASVKSHGTNGLVMHGQAPGFVLRRTLEWVEKRGEQWKYPELWDTSGKRLPSAKQVLYGNEVGGRGMFFSTCLKVVATGGTVTVDHDALHVRSAREVVLILSAATSYNGPSREGLDAAAIAERDISSATARGFHQLRSRHIRDYQALFHRASMQLGSSHAADKLPTDERIARFHQGEDPSFCALYVQYARYLTVSGSRVGTQPLNLQGIWNREVIPPWASGYTTNINVEMNYWPVDTLNLS